jgi:uncharacterized protein (DUF849 family)
MDGSIARIKVCLNGGRPQTESPGVPVTPAEAAASAAAAVAAGAEAVHVHPRGADGRESLDPAYIGATVAAVRQACPGVPVGVSTGVWITDGDADARLDAVARWGDLDDLARPDFASVNLAEPEPVTLARALRAGGIEIEAGVWSADDVTRLAEIGPAIRWLRILVEVMGAEAAGPARITADTILAALDQAGRAEPRLLHGDGVACWPLIAYAGQLGLPTRVGFEDTATGPDGGSAASNAELITRGLEVWGRSH